MKKTLPALVTAGVVATLLAGCTAGGDRSSSASPTATPSASAAAAAPAANTCTDGVLTVTDAKKAAKALAEGCKSVFLLLSNTQVTVGDAEKLGIEGSGVTVKGGHFDTLSVLGSGNTITYRGEAPDTTNVADGNEVTAAR
ncbi:DUF3060 domain-containing protein [Curtobacterium caseinilyticum]|uniref:DUF3060 domain-containing protein n=1 Tax=Curtobacterium caseinilyticum TaxID=3055137 RepID=A0ABT7TR14_9MICO|nr:DUF3060 domain-containing protein [Curtobacterium caseinilyticum]MDM7892031.1 DUF3060 domain-containing protein [Curtobacterium caseinilyticum]